ncbi:alcohol dehydrogenase catalytic domain-containing protein [Amycolatopsis sp. MEPSY49]|uniref:alcohol dehydrogenase catalytic domain-containing protein n=1 Tax=Amycolatopsis sp. MEPSY49 TaxID=3151600 RepID=UPI003EF84509
MTKAVRFAAEGGPDVLELVDVDLGEPGPGELRLRVEAIGLNRAEAMFRAGTYFERPREFPAKLGYSAAGIVEALGDGVTGFAIGDAVNTVAGFSMRDYGVYGEAAIVPASAGPKDSTPPKPSPSGGRSSPPTARSSTKDASAPGTTSSSPPRRAVSGSRPSTSSTTSAPSPSPPLAPKRRNTGCWTPVRRT